MIYTHFSAIYRNICKNRQKKRNCNIHTINIVYARILIIVILHIYNFMSKFAVNLHTR